MNTKTQIQTRIQTQIQTARREPGLALGSILLLGSIYAHTLLAVEPTTPEIVRGKLISIDATVTLHMYCVGPQTPDKPIVVTDSGVGGNHFDWHQVQQTLKDRLHVCAWDRAGYGFSTPGPRPRTSQAISDELKRLLDRLTYTRPILLVGHSFGGLNVLQYSANWPDHVAGIMLIDAVHFRQFEFFERHGIEMPTDSSRRFRLPSRTEITRGLPANLHDTAYRVARTDSARGAMYNELRNLPLSTSSMRDTSLPLPLSLPDVPLSVITHTNRAWDDSPLTKKMEKAWFELQSDLATLTPRGELLMAPASGHEIHIDNPQFVSRQILNMVDRIATGEH